MTRGAAYKIVLFLLFCATWLWSAIEPHEFGTWLLENILVLIFAAIIVLGGVHFRLSNISYTMITAYMILHLVGSHYTYSEVPFGYWLQDALDANRNMYDRLVHFSFGLLIAYPVREVYVRLVRARGFWSYMLPFELVVAWAGLYEVGEWLIWTTIKDSRAIAFIGTQGDVWDPQKDIALAAIGALIVVLAVLAGNILYDRTHVRKLWQSFRPPKNDHPLGEEAIQKMVDGK